MKIFGLTLGERIKKIDPIIFITVSFLSFMSILTIFGSVENFGKSKLVMQVAMTVMGTVAVFVLANIDYKIFVDRLYLILFIGSVLLLIVTLIFGITGTNMETANKSGKHMAMRRVIIIVRSIQIGRHHTNEVCSILSIEIFTILQSRDFGQSISLIGRLQCRSEQAILRHGLRSQTGINARRA